MVVAIVLTTLAVRAYSELSSARDSLTAATTDASELQTALLDGDGVRARAELVTLQARVQSAHTSLDSRILSVVEHTPFIGKNISAVRTVTNAVGIVADDALPPLVEKAGTFSTKSFRPVDGAIDIATIRSLSPNLAASAQAMMKANASIQAVDSSSLLSQVRTPVSDAQKRIARAASVASKASLASKILPQMTSGKHRYLLLFENNAEIRATGGQPGAYAILTVDNGRFSLGQQGAGGKLGDLTYVATRLTSEEKSLFTDLLGSDFRDVNFTPDFPRAADIAGDIIKRETGTSVDGVLSLDPVTLSYLLKGIGPVQLADGTRLTSENAVDFLLNGVYVEHADNPDKQDAIFAEATRLIFERVESGAGDQSAVMAALARGTNEGRVSVVVNDKNVTKALAQTPLSRALPIGAAAADNVGFYLNDATGAKMQYYLRYTIASKGTTCSADSVQSIASEVTLRSTAPADSASLPEWIRGQGFGAVPGTMLMNLYLYGPTSGAISKVTIDGKDTTYTRGTHHGRPVVYVTVQVDPGQTVTVQSTSSTASGQKGAISVSSTPSIEPGPSAQTWQSGC